MKKNYIGSIPEFHPLTIFTSEKEQLKSRGELAEAKLRLTQSEVRRMFSVAGQFFSLFARRGCFAEDLRAYKCSDKKSQEGGTS